MLTMDFRRVYALGSGVACRAGLIPGIIQLT